MIWILKTSEYWWNKPIKDLNGELYHVYGLEDSTMLSLQFSTNLFISLVKSQLNSQQVFFYRYWQIYSKIKYKETILGNTAF